MTGSVLLLTGYRNEPLGLRNAPARTSSSSLPSPYPIPKSRSPSYAIEDKKKTKDGAIILEPQPDDSHNDPLNWATWRRDSALLSLGFYCMIGGGMTPILAAGFTNVAQDFNVTVPQVALTTGLYMMGLGMAQCSRLQPPYFMANAQSTSLAPSFLLLHRYGALLHLAILH